MSPDIRAIPGVLNVTQDYINPFVVSKEFVYQQFLNAMYRVDYGTATLSWRESGGRR